MQVNNIVNCVFIVLLQLAVLSKVLRNLLGQSRPPASPAKIPKPETVVTAQSESKVERDIDTKAPNLQVDVVSNQESRLFGESEQTFSSPENPPSPANILKVSSEKTYPLRFEIFCSVFAFTRIAFNTAIITLEIPF